MIATLITTMRVFTHAVSFVPITSSQVMIATIPNAGRLKTSGMGPRCGTEASRAGSCRAVRISVTNQRGSSTPRPRSSESK